MTTAQKDILASSERSRIKKIHVREEDRKRWERVTISKKNTTLHIPALA